MESPEALIYQLLMRPDLTSGDIRGCLNQFAGCYFTGDEGSFLLVSIHNAKVTFLSAFADMVPMENIGYLAESEIDPVRAKRFI
jgi:hypothetical protein